MEKKDLINVENAAIRAAGSRMAKMFQPMGEHEGDKEARRAFYEGFQEGAAFYRLLISRIDNEFANLIEGARLDSGPEEDTHSVMEMCLKNGIPVITAVQKAPGKKETEKLREDVNNYIATVPLVWVRGGARSSPGNIPRKVNLVNPRRMIPPCPKRWKTA